MSYDKQLSWAARVCHFLQEYSRNPSVGYDQAMFDRAQRLIRTAEAIEARQLRTDLNTMREAMEAHARLAEADEVENELLRAKLAESERLRKLDMESPCKGCDALHADLAASREQTAAVLVELAKVQADRDERYTVDVYKASERQREHWKARAEAAEREVSRLREDVDLLQNGLRLVRDHARHAQSYSGEVSLLLALSDVEATAESTLKPRTALASPTTPAGEVRYVCTGCNKDGTAASLNNLKCGEFIGDGKYCPGVFRRVVQAAPIEAPGKGAQVCSCGCPSIEHYGDDGHWQCMKHMELGDHDPPWAPTIPTTEKGE